MAYEKYIQSVSLNAEQNLSTMQYSFVAINGDFQMGLAGSASEVVGVLVTNPKAGMAGTVVTTGITKIQVADGATVNAGEGVSITAGKAVGTGPVGRMLETVTGPGLGTILMGVPNYTNN